MTRKAFVKQADMKRMAAIVKEYGVRIEVEADGTILRILPDASSPMYEINEAQQSQKTLVSRFSTSGPKGRGGYTLSDNPIDPVEKWYKDLGFDPRTMGREDFARLQEEADELWSASVRLKPLGKLERVALGQLAEHGPNKKIRGGDIKNLGIATGERLTARGYLEVFMNPDDHSRLDHYLLTEKGMQAWQALQDEPEAQ